MSTRLDYEIGIKAGSFFEKMLPLPTLSRQFTGICKVYEVGEIEGHAYIAMQLIDGLSLQSAANQMSVPDKVQVIRDAALALHAAHELGIIHRDIKPANLVIEEKGRRPVPRWGEVRAGRGLRCGTIAPGRYELE